MWFVCECGLFVNRHGFHAPSVQDDPPNTVFVTDIKVPVL